MHRIRERGTVLTRKERKVVFVLNKAKGAEGQGLGWARNSAQLSGPLARERERGSCTLGEVGTGDLETLWQSWPSGGLPGCALKGSEEAAVSEQGEEAPAVVCWAPIIIKLHLCVSERVCTLQKPGWLRQTHLRPCHAPAQPEQQPSPPHEAPTRFVT